MSPLESNKNLDLSIKALFPQINNAENDEKCQVISSLFQEMATKTDLSSCCLEMCILRAEKRYKYLSNGLNLSLVEIMPGIEMLHNLGVSQETIQKYYSFKVENNIYLNETIKKLTC